MLLFYFVGGVGESMLVKDMIRLLPDGKFHQLKRSLSPTGNLNRKQRLGIIIIFATIVKMYIPRTRRKLAMPIEQPAKFFLSCILEGILSC